MPIPIAEVFESPQGEGYHTGVLMTFIRLAGCNVGKPYSTVEKQKQLSQFKLLQPYQEKCTSWDGTEFTCDTNYKMFSRPTIEQLVHMPQVDLAKHICFTGGEPFIHAELFPLMKQLSSKKLHIETSGTVFPDWLDYTLQQFDVWLTVSPKRGCLRDMLERAREIKILVGPDFSEKEFYDKFSPFFDKKMIWLSPINDEKTLNTENMNRCLDLQMRYKQLRVMSQMHKIWNVR